MDVGDEVEWSSVVLRQISRWVICNQQAREERRTVSLTRKIYVTSEKEELDTLPLRKSTVKSRGSSYSWREKAE